jgi:hypothetical protein
MAFLVTFGFLPTFLPITPGELGIGEAMEGEDSSLS